MHQLDQSESQARVLARLLDNQIKKLWFFFEELEHFCRFDSNNCIKDFGKIIDAVFIPFSLRQVIEDIQEI